MSSEDYYPPGFDQRLLDEDEEEVDELGDEDRDEEEELLEDEE